MRGVVKTAARKKPIKLAFNPMITSFNLCFPEFSIAEGFYRPRTQSLDYFFLVAGCQPAKKFVVEQVQMAPSPLGPGSCQKIQNRRRSGGRGSRRASWGKDVLGRWPARGVAPPIFWGKGKAGYTPNIHLG